MQKNEIKLWFAKTHKVENLFDREGIKTLFDLSEGEITRSNYLGSGKELYFIYRAILFYECHQIIILLQFHSESVCRMK